MSEQAVQATPDELVKAKQKPDIVDVPTRLVLELDGAGGPGELGFSAAITALYGIAYAIRNTRKKNNKQVFKVGPLVAEWRAEVGEIPTHEVPAKDAWRWRLQMSVPLDTTKSELAVAINDATSKRTSKLESNEVAHNIRLQELPPAGFARVLHIGSYATEPESFAKIADLLSSKGLSREPWHIEVYLSDPNRTEPDKLKTVLLTMVR